jgi:hypothetical protein
MGWDENFQVYGVRKLWRQFNWERVARRMVDPIDGYGTRAPTVFAGMSTERML